MPDPKSAGRQRGSAPECSSANAPEKRNLVGRCVATGVYQHIPRFSCAVFLRPSNSRAQHQQVLARHFKQREQHEACSGLGVPSGFHSGCRCILFISLYFLPLQTLIFGEGGGSSVRVNCGVLASTWRTMLFSLELPPLKYDALLGTKMARHFLTGKTKTRKREKGHTCKGPSLFLSMRVRGHEILRNTSKFVPPLSHGPTLLTR